MLLVAASLLGLISVAFGAYSEHALRPVVSSEEFRFLMTAVKAFARLSLSRCVCVRVRVCACVWA